MKNNTYTNDPTRDDRDGHDNQTTYPNYLSPYNNHTYFDENHK